MWLPPVSARPAREYAFVRINLAAVVWVAAIVGLVDVYRALTFKSANEPRPAVHS